jgi:hypothetical protein
MPIIHACDICGSTKRIDKVKILNLKLVCKDCSKAIEVAIGMIRKVRYDRLHSIARGEGEAEVHRG